MNRKIIFNYPPETNTILQNSQRFEESISYGSPQNLLDRNLIYFDNNSKHLKSLMNYRCGTDSTLEYKNNFANNFTKNYLYKVKKPIWDTFLQSDQATKIQNINNLIIYFNSNKYNEIFNVVKYLCIVDINRC